MAFGSRKLGLGARKVGDDRPRKKGEELRPVAPEPTISPSYFPSSVDGDGLARFTCVPAIELTLVMTCGPFTATTAIPATRDLVRLRAALIVSKDPDTAAGTFREYEARCWR
jgi:hypothetical protein